MGNDLAAGADTNMHERVERALRLSGSIGRQPAARLMVAAGVPDTVIARVLCEPAWRRRVAPRS